MNYSELATIAEEEFFVWFSVKIKGRFAYHWERRMIDGSVYRYDNRPHENLKHMKSFPKHFHDGSDEEIKEGELGEDPKEILRAFLQIARTKIHR